MGWVIEKIDKKKHDRTSFECGVEVLDEYLRKRANQEHNNHLNVTYVATTPGDTKTLKTILGYFTLSSCSLSREVVPPFFQKGIPSSYEIPSILLGRLAVNKNYHRKGLGHFLLTKAFSIVVDMATLGGIKCILVIAKDNNSAKFYERFGFVRLESNNKLILPVETLIKAGFN